MRKVLFWAVVACALAAPAAAASPHAGSARGVTPAAPHVQVSGKWTIVVRSRSGHVRRRVHFENSLMSDNPIGQFLSGLWTPGGWRLRFIVMATDGNSALKLDAPATVTDDDTVTVLKAQTTTTSAGTLNTVMSQVAICGNQVAPVDCATQGQGGSDFTAHGGLGIVVQTGDTLSAVVRLSFSVPAALAVDSTAAELFLAQVIRGAVTVGPWELELLGDSSRLPDDLSAQGGFRVSEFELLAHWVSPVDASVTSVQADEYSCAPTVSPAACAAPGAAVSKVPLFRHTLTATSQVVLDQQVTVHWGIYLD